MFFLLPLLVCHSSTVWCGSGGDDDDDDDDASITMCYVLHYTPLTIPLLLYESIYQSIYLSMQGPHFTDR
jgi:hypothetical protein